MAPRRRSSSGRSKTGGFMLFLGGLLAGAAVFYLFFQNQTGGGKSPKGEPPSRDGGREARPKKPEHSTKAPEGEGEGLDQSPATVVPGGALPGGKVRAALVIDDLGSTVDELAPIEGLGIPVSCAVLPFADQTAEVVAELRSRKFEILCHLPMEPRNGQQDPGPGALRLGMGDDELRRLTLDALKHVPGATGVNNHMGSVLSADEPAMRTILGVLAQHNLFFLDSRTSAQSVGYKVAVELGIPAAQRQVFLDDDPSPEAIGAQFDRFLNLARTKGAAIAIGHPHPTTLEVLKSRVPQAREQGVTFVPVSYLLDRPGDVQ
jgi:polysaccharide deacetylase 2 family uncharacterized protein YibQ